MSEKELLGNYRLVLGLEIHLHLKTKHKMFCGDDADFYNAEPNTHTCPVCLGLPGALPVPNFEAVRMTQVLGLALHCVLNKDSKFDRKHYFYPDLAKGYQISQYKQPLCGEGYVELSSGQKAEIERIHLEEDVAKSFHEKGKTLIDFNKSGIPLVEIVTKPTFKNIKDAVEFCKTVQDVVRFLEIGDVDMEKGQMRLEANISLRSPEMEEKGELPPYKVEIKNINSFRFMERAVRAEIVRQREVYEKGGIPIQENRGYNENKNVTVSQRTKEEAHDYRYFPEPDIPPMHFEDTYLEGLKEKLPELPWERKAKLLELGVSGQAADFLSGGGAKKLYGLFSDLVQQDVEPKKAANTLVNNKELWNLSAEEIKEKLKSEEEKITDTSVISGVVDRVIEQNQDAVENYRKGKTASLEFLVGQVMREMRGKADSQAVRKLISDRLEGTS